MDTPVPDYVCGVQGSGGGRFGGQKLAAKGLKVGVPKEYSWPGMQPEVKAAVRGAIQTLAELGAEVRQVSLPHTDLALPVYT